MWVAALAAPCVETLSGTRKETVSGPRCRAVPGEVPVAPPAWGGAERGGRTKPGCQRGGREKGKAAAAAEQVRRAAGVVPRWHRERPWGSGAERCRAVPRVSGPAGRGRLCEPRVTGSPRGGRVGGCSPRGDPVTRGQLGELQPVGIGSLFVKKEAKFLALWQAVQKTKTNLMSLLSC